MIPCTRIQVQHSSSPHGAGIAVHDVARSDQTELTGCYTATAVCCLCTSSDSSKIPGLMIFLTDKLTEIDLLRETNNLVWLVSLNEQVERKTNRDTPSVCKRMHFSLFEKSSLLNFD
jgi:hypothetical protein